MTVEDKDPLAYQHYGLNFPIYTHFTSPIRRYADLLVHRLLTISLKEKEKTRELIDGIDYARYAELCSEKSLNARRAGKDCQRLFHCLLLKEEGPKVFNCLIFDVDAQSISVFIDEINLHYVLKLTEDPRVDATMLFDEELKVVCTFKKPLMLADGLVTYRGRKEKEKVNSQGPNKASNPDSQPGKRPQANLCLAVYDKVKLKVETTTEFPLDLKCTMLITEDDVAEYEEIQQEQAERASAQMENTGPTG